MTSIDWGSINNLSFWNYRAGCLAGKASTDLPMTIFLADRKMGPTVIAVSLAANQVSAISLISAPAFVALKAGGGIKWLQFEFAVPISMIAIMFSAGTGFSPAFRRLGLRICRTTIRCGYTAYTVSSFYVFTRTLNKRDFIHVRTGSLPWYWACLFILLWLLWRSVAIAYTTIGGIMADVYSDIIQLIILIRRCTCCADCIYKYVRTEISLLCQLTRNRLNSIDFSHHGFGDGQTFAFWPMIIGCSVSLYRLLRM